MLQRTFLKINWKNVFVAINFLFLKNKKIKNLRITSASVGMQNFLKIKKNKTIVFTLQIKTILLDFVAIKTNLL